LPVCGRKFLPYVLSFGVLGLRWLANIEVRTRAEYLTREHVNGWLLYHFLITCAPFTTIVVGRFGHFAPAVWLYAGHTQLILACGWWPSRRIWSRATICDTGGSWRCC
jgi:uncharacterized membrane protein